MAIVDLRYAANLSRMGFSTDEIRKIIGLKADSEQPPESDHAADDEQEESPEENSPDDETTVPESDDNETLEEEEQEPEVIEPEKPKGNPLTRTENPKRETLTETLAKLL